MGGGKLWPQYLILHEFKDFLGHRAGALLPFVEEVALVDDDAVEPDVPCDGAG